MYVFEYSRPFKSVINTLTFQKTVMFLWQKIVFLSHSRKNLNLHSLTHSLTYIFEDNISQLQTDTHFVVLVQLLPLGQGSCYILSLLLPNLSQLHSIF